MMAMALITNGSTHVGRVRSSNQDSFLVNDAMKLFVVADGMGGHAGGEIASQLCVQKIQEYLGKNPAKFSEKNNDNEVLSELANAVNFASARIYEHSIEQPALRGMGTTASVIKVIGSKAYCAHVGDSRIYLVRSGFLYQITYDHSLVNEQIRAGVLTPEDAEQHHLKNVITRSVGYQEEEDVDTMVVDLFPGDLLLICSDGLHGKVNNEEISSITRELGPAAVEPLIQMSNDRGGEDNITVVIIKVQE